MSPPSNAFFSVLISWMVTFSSCLIWQIINFILPPNEYGGVYAWTTLENITTLLFTWWSWEILRHYFWNHDNVAECVRKLERIRIVRILEEEKHRELRKFDNLWKNCKNLASSSINQSVKRQIQWVHPRILLLSQKMCVKRHQHQFTVVLNNWTFPRHHWDEFCIKTLVWRHTKFNWFRSHLMRFRFAKWVCDRFW